MKFLHFKVFVVPSSTIFLMTHNKDGDILRMNIHLYDVVVSDNVVLLYMTLRSIESHRDVLATNLMTSSK